LVCFQITRAATDFRIRDHSQARPALLDQALGADCVRHARLFLDRPDFDFASAKPGTFAIKPAARLCQTISMIFGAAPSFEEIMASIDEIDAAANRIP
jgi:hypothetical protein